MPHSNLAGRASYSLRIRTTASYVRRQLGFLGQHIFLVLSCTAPRALASLACHVVNWICYRRFSLACVPLFIQQVLRKASNQRRFFCNNIYNARRCIFTKKSTLRTSKNFYSFKHRKISYLRLCL